MTPEAAPSTRQSPGFLLLYALAWAGGAVAYVPFLTILLPMRVAAMVPDQRVEWLAYMTFCGAIAASVGGILFGWLSDRTGVRRPWIITGLIGAVSLLMCVPLARQPSQLLLLIVVWQLALNMMLGPLSAWAADHFPRAQLGVLGGLLALSPALGSAAGALVTIPRLAGPDGRLALVGLLVAACVIPALMFARPLDAATDALLPPPECQHRIVPAARAMWLARFLVQICEATLFAYLYYFFRSIDPTADASSIARLFSVVACTAVPAALLVGHWSDRRGKPMTPLIACAFGLGVALIGLSLSTTAAQATAAYILFGFATMIFLSLHSAQTLRVLGSANLRGRDLGIFNLTNTAPSMIMPWMTVAVVPMFGFSRLFLMLAVLAGCAAATLTFVALRSSSLVTMVPKRSAPARG